MTDYIRKPAFVSAVQWRGDNLEEIMGFFGSNLLKIEPQNDDSVFIETEHGILNLSMNEWIVLDSLDDIEICSPEEFERGYDPIDEMVGRVREKEQP